MFDANVAWMQLHHICETPMLIQENHYIVGELAGRDLELEELTAFDFSYILRIKRQHELLPTYCNYRSEISFLREGIGGDTVFVQEISQNIDKSIKG